MNWATTLLFLARLLPKLIGAVETIAKDKGKPLETIFDDVVAELDDHITPGRPNSPSLTS